MLLCMTIQSHNSEYRKQEVVMSPQKSQDNMKGNSPSKLIQNAVDTAWGAQNKDANTTAQGAIADQHNKNPFPVGNSK
jgi:hypothetical protein